MTSKLCPSTDSCSIFFIMVSQAIFMSDNICFILCALNVGVNELRIRFQSSPLTMVNMLLSGSGNLNKDCSIKNKNFIKNKRIANPRAKFPHSPILHYACRSLLTENNGKNNTTAVGLCAVFVVSWWRNKGLHTLNCMHNEVWGCAEI